MRNKFDEQLALLNTELIQMGALCEEAISKAAKALEAGDPALAEQVKPLEGEIDQMERDIETLCLKLLLQQQPVARDLRQISAAMKIITDMERIGDQAADIAEIIRACLAQGYVPEDVGHIREMVSRVKAVLRRCRPVSPAKQLTAGGLTMELEERTVTADGARILLTYKEFELLRLFLSRPGVAFTREQLLSDIWGVDYTGETRTVDMHIKTLRQKLGDYGGMIETVRHIGYRLEAKA